MAREVQISLYSAVSNIKRISIFYVESKRLISKDERPKRYTASSGIDS